MEDWRKIKILPIAIFALAHFSISSIKAEELDLEKIIVGTWCEDPADTGVCSGYTVFYEDGRTFGYGLLPEYNLSHESYGKYTVQDNITCITPLDRHYKERSTGNYIELELPFFKACSQTIALTPKEITYKWVLPKLDEPRIKTMRKVSDRALEELPFFVDYEAVVE